MPTPTPTPLFPQLRAAEGGRGRGREGSVKAAARCRPWTAAQSVYCRRKRVAPAPESPQRNPGPHTWPLTSPSQGTPGSPDKRTESQVEFSHRGRGHVARCDPPTRHPRVAVWLQGPAGRLGVSEGARGLSQGQGGYRQRPPGRRRPRGAGGRVWGGEQRGGPGAGGGSPCGCDWEAAACGQRLGDLLGWGAPADCAENHGVGEQWTLHTMRSRKQAHTHTHTPTRHAHSEPQVERPCRHPPPGCGASLPGLAPGPHPTQARKLGKFPGSSGP